MAAKAKFDEPIYILCGKDEYLISTESQKIIDTVLSPDEKAVSLLSIEADKAVAADIFDELRTVSFFDGKRVVLLKNADKFISDNRTMLEKYFDKPSSNGLLILTVSSWGKTTKLAKKIRPAQLIKIEPVKGVKVVKFITDYARDKYSKVINSQAALMIAELTAGKPGRAVSEIDKLAIYTADRKRIEMDDVLKLVGTGSLFDAFNVIDAMNKGDVNQAVLKLRRMFAVDKNSEYTVVGAFAYHFRQMLTAKAALAKGMNIADAMRKSRIWYNKDVMARRISKLSIDRIGWMIKELAKIDYSVKTGQTQTAFAMEELIVKCAIINRKTG